MAISSLFNRRNKEDGSEPSKSNGDVEMTISNNPTSPEIPLEPTHTRTKYNHNGHKITKGIKPAGESGRKWIHPVHFFKICWASSSDISRIVNVLWPIVPAAIAVKYARPDAHLAIFVLNYIAMVPCAMNIGFAGQEMARKVPHVFGVLLETTFGSVVEIILFMVLLTKHQYSVIKAAILGSILATQLLCLGMCFFAGGIGRHEQTFDEAVSEVGSGLLLTAGFGLIIPAAFNTAVSFSSTTLVPTDATALSEKVLHVSRITSILLIIAYATYIYFQTQSHHGIYKDLLMADEERDEDRHEEMKKAKLTLTECIIALAISIALVTLIAIALVEEIPFIVEERNISDSFVGLILIPLVEKAAEHLTAVDEAWDNQMNFALSHVLGATIQTALFNAPLVVMVGWGKHLPMDLNFDVFNIVVLILAILVVGNFLRDQKSNYLEGALCVYIYIIIAVAAYYYPNPLEGTEATTEALIELAQAG